MRIDKIYLDMDGVLADFDRGVIELCHMEPRKQGEHNPAKDNLLWGRIKEIPHFYDKLEPMPDSKELFDSLIREYGNRCEILSGIPKPKRGILTAGDDKIAWVRRNLSDSIKVNVVYREEKPAYVTGPGCILIDDYDKNIQEWNEAGGNGILYTSVAEVLNRIKALSEE